MQLIDPTVRELIQEKSFSLLSVASIISITDVFGKIVYANENFVKISGYSQEELIGSRHNIVNSGHHPRSFWTKMWKSVTGGETWRGEVRNKTKTGDYYWVDAQIMPVRNTKSEIVAFLSVRNNITREKDYEIQLEKDKHKLSAIYNNSSDSHVLIGPDLKVVSFNKSASRFVKTMYDLELEDGKSIYNYVPDESREEFNIRFRKALEGKEVKTDQKLTQKNGKSRWYRILYAPVFDSDGTLIGVSRNCADINKRKNAEESLLRESQRLGSLIESIPDAIFFKDGNGRWLITNEPAKQLFKLHSVDWVGKSDAELAQIHPEYKTAHEVCIVDDEKAWLKRKLTFFSEFVTNDAGEIREYEVRKLPIFNQDGSRRALVIIGTDVTERKRDEAELLRAKEMLEQTMRLAKIGGFEVDFTTSKVSWNGLTREMVEVPEGYEPEFDSLIEFYKKGESRERMRKLLKRAMTKGEEFEAEVELVSSLGKQYWLRTLHVPKMVGGKCTKLNGYFQDITRQIELASLKEEAEIRFKHLIEKSTDAIVLLDSNNAITYYSPSAAQILGYGPKEALGKNRLDFIHPDDIDTFFEDRNHEIANSYGASFPFTVDRLKKKDGNYIFVQGTVTNLLHDKYVKALVVHFRDVTQQRMVEEQLFERNEKMEQIAWLFSHEVRGPVATILGLIQLFNHEQKFDPINEAVIAKILIPATQLDEIISKIVRQTNELDLAYGNRSANSSI